jgi:hypothetical protein
MSFGKARCRSDLAAYCDESPRPFRRGLYLKAGQGIPSKMIVQPISLRYSASGWP